MEWNLYSAAQGRRRPPDGTPVVLTQACALTRAKTTKQFTTETTNLDPRAPAAGIGTAMLEF
jgi:hypothetical protein